MSRKNFTYDALTLLKDAGAITSSAAAQVSGSNQIVDLGGDPSGQSVTGFKISTGQLPEINCTALIDLTAATVAANDQVYTIRIQGSNSSTFASGVVDLATLPVGHATAIGGGVSANVTTGRFRIRFSNEKDGTVYRYVRAYTSVAGSGSPSVNYSARLAFDPACA